MDDVSLENKLTIFRDYQSSLKDDVDIPSFILDTLVRQFVGKMFSSGHSSRTSELIASHVKEDCHFKQILLAIDKSEEIGHGDLAKCVGISKSQLTRSMGSLVFDDIVAFETDGRTKTYYLSKFGRSLIAELKKPTKSHIRIPLKYGSYGSAMLMSIEVNMK